MTPSEFPASAAAIEPFVPVPNPASATASGRVSRGWLGAAFALMAVVWFASLGTRSLIHPDEGRYAALALEMARSGDWVTPRLDGLLYFEKPALQYWIGAIIFKLLGATDFAARLWPGLAGFLTVLMVGFTARRLWGMETGIRALAIAGSTTWIFANSHFLTLDAGLTLFLTLALCAILLAEQNGLDAATRRRWAWAAWAAMAGAMLTKGLVGIVIPGCALIVASLWLRDFSLWRRMHLLSGGAIFLALTAPWFVLVSLRNPGFAEFFFIHEHFARYLTKTHHREGAWWFYGPFLLGGLMPWTSGLPWLLRHGGAAETGAAAASPSSSGSLQAMDDGELSAHRFARTLLIAWVGFIFLFFSASGSKLPSYILPMFPALALLTALQLRDVSAARLRWHLLVPVLAWGGILVASMHTHRYGSGNTPAEVLSGFATAGRYGALLFLGAAALAWDRLGKQQVTAALLWVAAGHFAGSALVLQSHDGFGQLKSAAPIAAALRPVIDKDTPVFALRVYDQTLPFYLGRNVVLVDYIDEFAYGQQHEPGKSIPTVHEFVTRWQALPRAAAYMARSTWQELNARGVPMRIVFEDPRRLVVVKP